MKIVGRERRKLRIRKKVNGSPARPRLTVFRSAKHIYAQVIDDTTGQTVAHSSTLSKDLTESTGLPISPYVGYSYGQFDDHGRVIGGVNINFNEWMQGQAIYDGQKVHPMLNFSFGRHQFGVLFAQGKNPGVSYSIDFYSASICSSNASAGGGEGPGDPLEFAFEEPAAERYLGSATRLSDADGNLRFSVTLPGDYLARSVSYEPAALLRWEGGAVQPAADFGVAPGILENGMYPVHRGSHGPARVELPDASSLRSIEVRVGGDEFLVASSRPLAFGPGRGPLVIRTGAEALDIVITLPRGTRSFQLHGADGDLVRLQDGQLAAACQPSIALQAPDRQSVTLRPAGGGLRCR